MHSTWPALMMLEATHDPSRLAMMLRDILAADSMRIGFFVGAGCSLSIRMPGADPNDPKSTIPLIPDIAGLTTAVVSVLAAHKTCAAPYQALCTYFAEEDLKEPNVEVMLSHIRLLRSVAGKKDVRGLNAAQLTELDLCCSQVIANIVGKNLPDKPNGYLQLAAWIDGASRHAPVEIFTTNYDLLIEEALEKFRVPFFDGFSGTNEPFFDTNSIERNDLPPRWVRVWKLHGSINWFERSMPDGSRIMWRGIRGGSTAPVMIHPSHQKYDQSRRMPYLALMDRLRGFLSQPSAVLFVAGYSFGDEHLNGAILDALQANPTASCFAFQYGSHHAGCQAMKLAQRRPNLNVFYEDRSVQGTQVGSWQLPMGVEADGMRGVFSLVDDKDRAVPGSPTKWSHKLDLGDFGSLGAFLAVMAGMAVR